MSRAPGAAETIWRSDARGISLRHSTTPSAGLEQLLSRTIWGDSDIRYRVLGIAGILSAIADPHFITLEDGQSVIGGMVCGRKRTMIGERPCNAIHIAMLAIDPSHTGHGYGPLLAKRAKPFLVDLLGGPGVIYLYVEATHHASIELHRRMGYRDLALLDAHIFARLSPEISPDLRTIDSSEREGIARALETAYDGHVLADFEQSLLADRYYVIDTPGEVRAGVQISEMRWSLESLPGAASYLVLSLLPRLPWLAEQFRPSDFRFLRASNILPAAEADGALSRLLEACLAEHGVNAAMLFTDPRSPVQKTMVSRLHPGLIDRLVGGQALALADFAGLDAPEIEWLTTNPMLVSPMDAI